MGYYGYGDVGDEAILDGILSLIPPGSDVCVLSSNPVHTEKSHGVRSQRSLLSTRRRTTGNLISTLLYVMYLNLKKVFILFQNVGVMSGTNLFILGGGGLIQDSYKGWKHKLPIYLFYILLAKILNKKIMVLSVGAGPLETGCFRLLTKVLFNQVDVITVRDAESKEVLEQAGISRSISVVPDPALLLFPKSYGKDILKQNSIPTHKPIVGVCVHGWIKGFREGNKIYKSRLLEFITFLKIVHEKHSLTIVIIPTGGTSGKKATDPLAEEICSQLPECHVLPGEFSPSDMMELLSNIDILISMRLHAIILASNVFTPSMGIVTDEKMMNFMRMTGQEGNTIAFGNLEPRSTFKVFEKAFQKKDESRRQLRIKASELNKHSQENGILIRKILGGYVQ